MLENKLIKTWYGEIEISRIITSWLKAGGPSINHDSQELFFEWLNIIIVKPDEETLWGIWDFATNGKLELQSISKMFLKSKR